MAEYILPYSAEEIEEKLGSIDEMANDISELNTNISELNGNTTVISGNITDNVFGVNIPYYKIGKLVTIVIDALKLNKIPNTAAWNASNIATLPSEIMPDRYWYFPVVIDKAHYIKDIDGNTQNLNTDYALSIRPNGNGGNGVLSFVTRYAAANFSSLTDGYGMFTTITYVCK